MNYVNTTTHTYSTTLLLSTLPHYTYIIHILCIEYAY